MAPSWRPAKRSQTFVQRGLWLLRARDAPRLRRLAWPAMHGFVPLRARSMCRRAHGSSDGSQRSVPLTATMYQASQCFGLVVAFRPGAVAAVRGLASDVQAPGTVLLVQRTVPQGGHRRGAVVGDWSHVSADSLYPNDGQCEYRAMQFEKNVPRLLGWYDGRISRPRRERRPAQAPLAAYVRRPHLRGRRPDDQGISTIVPT